MSISNLWSNKLRTFLSLLGVTLGIFVMISILTLVASLKKTIEDSISVLGDDVIYVQKWPIIFSEEYPWWKYVNRPEPTLNEAEFVAKNSNTASAVSFIMEFSRAIKSVNSDISRIQISGVSHSYAFIRSLEFDQGRFFTEMEANGGQNVIILGYAVAEALFPNEYPLDKYVKIGGKKLRVVGVLKKEGESMMGPSQDNQALVPVQTGGQLANLKSSWVSKKIMMKAKEGVGLEEMKDETMGLMRSVRALHPAEEESFSIMEITLLTNMLDDMFVFLYLGGIIISGFSFLVGGFGIANIMFVSVRERTNQIGIQKALGAKKSFIRSMFLLESITLCILGGLVGIGLVFILALVANNMSDFTVALSLENFVVGILLSSVVGILSGLLPAIKASKLDPVEAIRM